MSVKLFRRLAMAALIPFAAACGDDFTAPAIEDAEFAPSLGVDLAASTRLPSGVYIRDVQVGTGAEATQGKRAATRYRGYFRSGLEFDNNFEEPAPFTVVAGVSGAIPGYVEGVKGMKVGGRRQVIIPPEMAYGPFGTADGKIPPNTILVFMIDLVGVTDGP